jgi:UDP-N-acetylmuramoyl-tripeptide--D-alanyl-D-alanine ligase
MEKLFPLLEETSGVCTDTRNISQNCLFIALKGDNFNGNEFADQAINLGAKYAIVDELEKANNSTIFYVNNGLLFLQKLANHHRHKFDIPVVGITGSNGKTSTKELIHTILSKQFNVLYTIGNLNNHIGVPLTLLRLNKTHEIAIIEMGANQPNDIEELCSITDANAGIITNIGKAHLEGFKNLEGVIHTKSQLYKAVGKINGTLFYNIDDSILMDILPTNTENHSYGMVEAEVNGELHELTPYIKMSWSKNDYSSPIIETKVIGKYNFYNFLAAICIGNHYGVSEENISEAIADYLPDNNRSQVQKTKKNTIIIDCYNANPTSMSLALESFNLIDHPKKIAIIGDMLELGPDGIEEHQNVIEYCLNKEIPIFTIGPLFRSINETGFVNTSEIEQVLSNLEDCLILLKGSRGIRLEKLIPIL